MAEDLAREIIAQSAGGSKLAFSFVSFDYGVKDLLLYISKDAGERTLYHVHRPLANETYDEFKYADLESAVDLVRTFIRGTNFLV
jgi:SAM-dependent MidA family methyltransferase